MRLIPGARERPLSTAKPWLERRSVAKCLVGDHFGIRIAPNILKRIFGWSTMVLGIWMLVKECVISE